MTEKNKHFQIGVVVLMVLIGEQSVVAGETAPESKTQCENRLATYLDGYNDLGARVRTARRVYVYAMMSANAYDDSYQFPLPSEWERVERYAGDRGLAYHLYLKQHNGVASELTFAFRGTEFWSAGDWLHGNLGNGQYALAIEHIEAARANTQYANASMSVTGHSLGGGLAMRASFDYADTPAYTFSTSPMYRENPKHKNPKTIVFESGDPVRNFSNFFLPHRWRWIRREGQWEEGVLDDPNTIYFQKYDFMGWGLTSDHSMTVLAEGLLSVAASVDPEAATVLQAHCSKLAAHIPPN